MRGDFPEKPGLYLLRFPDGTVYLGASTEVARRVSQHFWLHKKTGHPNPRVQDAFCRCGADRVRVRVWTLPVETPEELAAVETVAIRALVQKLGRERVLNQSLTPSAREFRKMMLPPGDRRAVGVRRAEVEASRPAEPAGASKDGEPRPPTAGHS